MQNEKMYIVLFESAVFISSISQVILKESAKRVYKNRIQEYVNIPVISAYILFLGATLLTTAAYKYISLSMGPILESTGYVWVAVMGRIFLKERVSKKKMLGLILIIGGIAAFNVK